ncbi:MAG TPA: glutaredoxin domain-containing protein [Dehalococcoidia bacterium]|nr:glutaredoxin domain-containing protein [Dehalococcoidia bacterium]
MILYTHPNCDYSPMKKNELDDDGIDYDEIDLSLLPQYWIEIEKICKGVRITPILINVDGSPEIGYQGIGSDFS